MNAAVRPTLTLEAFEAAAIDPAAFDHEGHVYVGWLYLERLPLLEALQRYSGALRRLTERLGVPDKYHETITWFYLVLIAERRDATRGHGWFAFRSENDDLFHARAMLARYYSEELLMSNRARQTFVLPDRLHGRSPVRTDP
jgi:hypothetical protein